MPVTPGIEIEDILYSFPTVPAGGSTGQVLTKASSTDLDITWADPSGGVTSVNGQTGAVTLTTNNIETANDKLYVSSSEKSSWSGKQDTLVSGTNIKTVKSTSLLGSGNIAINEVPNGGTTGQSLVKHSNTDQDLEWSNIIAGTTIDNEGYANFVSTEGTIYAGGTGIDIANGLISINSATQTTIANKLDASKCTFQTTEPASAISDGGVHIVYLASEPQTKYDGYIYLIAES